MVFTEESTMGAFLLRARREGLRDFGACMSPHSAWLILQGIETLPLRMERHMRNTEKVVQFLASHPSGQPRGPPHAGIAPQPCPGAKAAARAARARCSALTCKGNRRAGQEVHRNAQGLQPPGQCGRLPLPGDPPGQHHALPHERRSAGGRRHRPGHDPPVDSAWKTPTT